MSVSSSSSSSSSSFSPIQSFQQLKLKRPLPESPEKEPSKKIQFSSAGLNERNLVDIDLNKANILFCEKYQPENMNPQEFLNVVAKFENQATFVYAIRHINQTCQLKSNNPSFQLPECSSCLLPIEDLKLWFPEPQLCSLDHFICQSCKDQVLTSSLGKCAMCQTPCSAYVSNPSYVSGLRRMLKDNYHFECLACQHQQISFEESKSHASVCEMRCQKGCGLLLNRQEAAQHECFQCYYCHIPFQCFEGLKNHLNLETCTCQHKFYESKGFLNLIQFTSHTSSSSSSSSSSSTDFNDGFCILTEDQIKEFNQLKEDVKSLFLSEQNSQKIHLETFISSISMHYLDEQRDYINWARYITTESFEYIASFQFYYERLSRHIRKFFAEVDNYIVFSDFVCQLQTLL